MSKKIIERQVEWMYDTPDCWPGAGLCNTGYAHIAIGSGDDPEEAWDTMLDMIAENGHEVPEEKFFTVPEGMGWRVFTGDRDVAEQGWQYYAIIRYNTGE